MANAEITIIEYGNIQKGFEKGVLSGLQKVCIKTVAQAKALTPVDTSRLRNSISYSLSNGLTGGSGEPIESLPPKGSAFVGSNVEYACIFNPKTMVVTKKGIKRISSIKKGDLVLTQTGDYKKVLKKIVNNASDFSNLIEIEYPYRKGKTHKLIVTENHKILIYRDGKNKWVEAKDLKITDFVFSKNKVAHNKHSGEKKKCPSCGSFFYGQNRKYCSMECRNTDWVRHKNNPHIGMKRSEISKNKMSQSAKKKFKNNPELHPNKIMAKKGFSTNIEKKVEDWLKEDRCVQYEKQKKIGRFYVDFYLPETNEVIEADGGYWHKDIKKDLKRDIELLKCDDSLKITHIHFYDKRHSPKGIDKNPLINVFYVVCNPSTTSYCNDSVFSKKKIISISKKKYKQKGSHSAKVYDLSVEGIHSYVAGSMVVSNSYVEFGTRRQVPQPYLRPAVDIVVNGTEGITAMANAMTDSIKRATKEGRTVRTKKV
jgi:very-short-patch-repair endonuclease